MYSESSMHLAGISKQERKFLDIIALKGGSVVSKSDVSGVLGLTPQQSNLFLSRLAKKGWLRRLKAGFYQTVQFGSVLSESVSEYAWNIAMELFSPCYIGGWTAAEHWDLTEQIHNSTVVYSSKKQRITNQKIGGLRYQIKFLEEVEVFGLTKIWSGSTQIFISDQHRTLIDILGDPEMGGGGRAMIDIAKRYAQQNTQSLEKLINYAEKLDKGAVFKRLGFLTESILSASTEQRERIKKKCKSGIILVDPNGPVNGRIISEWGIRQNIPVGD